MYLGSKERMDTEKLVNIYRDLEGGRKEGREGGRKEGFKKR